MLSFPRLNSNAHPASRMNVRVYCGPTTPDSPCGSSGLGCSEFARHYYRNHGCFLFLQVLRWFTSLGSLPAPMNSAQDTRCSHQVGSPIRTSPDHRMLASPRGFSQLATSFFACLRLGILTHALSSLTIKLTPNIRVRLIPPPVSRGRRARLPLASAAGNLCCYPSDIQLSKISKITPV